MFVLTVLLCCLGALVSSAPQKVFYNIEYAEVYFEEFLNTYNKEYCSELEKQYRSEVFRNNLNEINQKNKMHQNTVFGINQFTDLTQEEFTQTYTGFLPLGLEGQCTPRVYNGTGVAAPDSFDWRDQNKVTSVKSQEHCGACWAFSTVGTIEGQYAIKHNQLVDLAPQQLVDCVQRNFGCDGGWMSNAVIETAQFGGIMAEQSYPYVAAQGQCRADPNNLAVRVTGCRQFYPSGEPELKETLAQVGPLSIAVAATTWNQYSGGIMESCDNQVNHAVLLVGYGSEGGRPYWIIKNSWGPGWGENGYIRLSMNQNTCNLMGGQFVTADVQ